jgi:CheY-like chemotaxis protein
MPLNRPLVLLVDNHADTRDMYAEYLRIRGFRVIACSDSRASIDLARSCTPNIILLELRMNGMNGTEVLARLKQEPSLVGVPMVALTASVMTFERSAAMAAGFTELLPKPCFPEDLASAIIRLLHLAAPLGSVESMPDVQTPAAPHSGLRANNGVVPLRQVRPRVAAAALAPQSSR